MRKETSLVLILTKSNSMTLPTIPANNNDDDEESIRILYLPANRERKLAGIYLSLFVISFSIFFIFQHFATTNEIPVLLLNLSLFLLVIALIALIMLLYAIKTKVISFTKDELEFPSNFGPDLLFRQIRAWDDISNILLGSMILDKSKSTYEYELDSAKNNKRIFLYFKSGGHAHIDLNRLNKKGSEKLFSAIESWCLDYSRIPRENKDKDEKQLRWDIPIAPDRKLPDSYTELWEQELQDNYSSTNFVPLKKGDFVQDSKYKVLMPLSSGGLSAVYLVQSKDGKLRVLKESVIPENLELREKARQLFKREAALLQKIEHPDIANVYDYFVENDRDYLLFEFIRGNTLRQLLAQNGPLEEEDALKLALFTTGIVKYLHQLDPPVIHRDITPSNLVRKEDGTIALIDFGAANELISSATGTLIGKRAYMSPEQFRGRATEKSDLYGIGATLFFLLTGEDPRPLEEQHPRLQERSISPDTDSLVAFCTKQNQTERIGSAKELEEKLLYIIKHGGGAIIDTTNLE